MKQKNNYIVNRSETDNIVIERTQQQGIMQNLNDVPASSLTNIPILKAVAIVAIVFTVVPLIPILLAFLAGSWISYKGAK
jgi:hypothetical protein